MTGHISIRPVASDDTIWRQAVSIALGPYESAARQIRLPVKQLKPDDYRVDWLFDATSSERAVGTRVIYQPQLRDRLRKLVVSADAFAALDCPRPSDPRDAAIVRYKVDHLARLLDREASNIEIDLGTPIVQTYRKLRDIVFAVRTRGRYAADRRGSYEAAITSTVDGSRQPYALFVPHDYDQNGSKTYRLVIKLHGASGTHGGEKGGADATYADSFVLAPLGRGRFCGFAYVSGRDILQQIGTVMANYRIDPDAVHLQGGSMGGFGSFSIGSSYPDLFATCMPYCGGGYAPLEQMVNLPTFVHHGLADNSVRPSESIFAVAQMQHGHCPVQMYLHPGVGHGVTVVAMGISTWEMRKDIRRDRDPRTVVLSGELPALKKAYWLGICRYTDPHAEAYLRATFVGPNHLDLTATNVQWLKVSLPTRWIDPARPVQITTDKGYRWTQIAPGEAEAVYVRLDRDAIEATTTPPSAVNDPTAYLGGGVRRMFTEGRAVRIVYGSAGSAEQTTKLAKLAEDLSPWNAFGWVDFEVGGYPVLKDVDADQATLESCDLILLGTPAENALVARMADRLPVRVVDGQLIVTTTPAMQWNADGVCLSLYYRNPLAPARRIWWFAGVSDMATFKALAGVTERVIFRPTPDLVVVGKDDSAVVATAMVQLNWTLARPGAGTLATNRWASPSDLHRQAAEAIKAAFPVHVSLVKGPRDPADASASRVRWADLTVDEAIAMIPPRRMLIVQMTGRELLDVHARGQASQESDDHGPMGLSPEARLTCLLDRMRMLF